MLDIDQILQSDIKPKEKQTKLVEAVLQKQIAADAFIDYFKIVSDVDKGTCADVIKNISARDQDIIAPYIDTLIPYINHRLPRVKWGVPEAIGNMAKKYPKETSRAIPYLLKNVTKDKLNTTVKKWCSAFALAEIAEYNSNAKKQFVPIFADLIKREENSGVKNV
jgi:hypothetical protein